MALLPQISDFQLEAGCDEAGRGCLAGPVVAAAVILPPDFHHPWLNDSKQVGKSHREALRKIIESEALFWGIGSCTPTEIDKINILNASILAMHRAPFYRSGWQSIQTLGRYPPQNRSKGRWSFLTYRSRQYFGKNP
jgi:hypothetical protein